jgi:neutral ceramidase
MLQAGFARLDITPPLGISIQGYFHDRKAEGILDPLLASAVAFRDDERTAVAISLDLIGIDQETCDVCRNVIARRNNLAYESILITCTHTHLGPVIYDGLYPKDPVYNEILFRKIADTVNLALADLQPASVSIGRNTVKNIAFIRRFLMKDGSIRTNPGRHNPEIDHPIGDPDESIQLVRITRGAAPEILMVNFQVHSDVIGGNFLSADYPKFLRDTLECALDNVRCIFFNGAQGDTNHINVQAPPWDKNGGYEHARHMGRSLAGAVLQIYGKTEKVSGERVDFCQKNIRVPSSRTPAEMIPRAEQIIALHEAGRDEELPETGMGIVTLVAEAYRMKQLADGPDFFELYLPAIRFGGIVLTGAPGEPFTEIGRAVKAASPFAMTLYCCCADGCEAYFPTRDAFDEGGYEARSSKFKAGIGESIIAGGNELLQELF